MRDRPDSQKTGKTIYKKRPAYKDMFLFAAKPADLIDCG